MVNSFDSWETELYHHGIKGQKWGIRKYQREDGSLTAEGLARYGYGGTASARERAHFLNSLDRQRAHAVIRQKEIQGRRKNKTLSSRKQEKYDAYEKLRTSTEKTMKKVLSNAKKEKMQIKEAKNIKRNVITGRTVAKSLGLSMALTAIGGTAVLARGVQMAQAIGATSLSVRFPMLGIATIKRTTGTKYKALKYN